MKNGIVTIEDLAVKYPNTLDLLAKNSWHFGGPESWSVFWCVQNLKTWDSNLERWQGLTPAELFALNENELIQECNSCGLDLGENGGNGFKTKRGVTFCLNCHFGGYSNEFLVCEDCGTIDQAKHFDSCKLNA